MSKIRVDEIVKGPAGSETAPDFPQGLTVSSQKVGRVTNWIDYAGSAAGVTGYSGVAYEYYDYRLVGQNMEIRFRFTHTGVSAAEIVFPLPAGYTVDVPGGAGGLCLSNIVTSYSGTTQGGIFALATSIGTITFVHNNGRSGFSALPANGISTASGSVTGVISVHVNE